ncbi:TadE/TadG family type IV pilus assembly protein [Sphingomonas bacterium]|uniref:TadE/TadG family type IV pilus assembly protein n=1 Tax=Sphingomonas bacterium TaxID=1895847 RepID=UPI0015761B58|nr:TadE/TadG family type IV pilus assembly protein [Sphingomonas bacterium]
MASRLERDGSLARLARDERGVTVIEFAFVAGPLFALIIAILQVSLTFFAQQTLETATLKASRQLMTGVDQSAGMSQAGFLTAVCNQLPGFMKCANVRVDVQSTTSFSSANTSAPTITYNAQTGAENPFAYSPGGSGQITTVKVMYIWATSKGPLGFDLSTMSGGNRLLIATAVFKTEPSAS